MKRTILIAVDVDDDEEGQEGHRGLWHVTMVRSRVIDENWLPGLAVIGLSGSSGEVDLDESADFPIYDIPLPDAATRKEQCQGLSLQMGYW